MGKYNKLAKNTGVFFIANFGSKVLTFLLVRFYTELLSPSEYGIIDLLNTTASLAFPLVTLCVMEAVLRFSIDDIDNRGKILTNGLFVTVLGNLAFVLTAPIFSHIDNFADNVVWLYLLTLTNSLFTLFAFFTGYRQKQTVCFVGACVYRSSNRLEYSVPAFFQMGYNGIFYRYGFCKCAFERICFFGRTPLFIYHFQTGQKISADDDNLCVAVYSKFRLLVDNAVVRQICDNLCFGQRRKRSLCRGE